MKVIRITEQPEEVLEEPTTKKQKRKQLPALKKQDKKPLVKPIVEQVNITN